MAGVSHPFDLTGRIALVTGASRGIGRAIAVELARAGADVAVVGRDEQALADTVQQVEGTGRRCLPLLADVTRPEQVRRCVEGCLSDLGGLHILVNNAGVTLVKPIGDIALAEWQRVMDTNVTAAFLFCQAAGPHFIQQGGGKVINVASIAGLIGGTGVYLAYSVSKGAMVSFTRALAMEWARYRINVNAIAPGTIYTDMTAAACDDPDIRERYLRRIPWRRFGRVEDVAPAAVFLASDAADYVTGEVLVIDGGVVVR